MVSETNDQPQNDEHRHLLVAPDTLDVYTAYILAAIVLPLASFLLTFPGNLISPSWQNGNFFQMMAGGPASYYFYPLLIFSMISLAVLLNSPSKAVNFIYRWGIYTGAIFSFQYFLLILFLDFDKRIIIYGCVFWLIVIPVLYICFSKLYRSKAINKYSKIFALILFGVIFFIVVILIFPILIRELMTALFALFFVGPGICLFVYIQISIRLIRYYEIPITVTIWQSLTVASWFGAFLVAWHFSILKAIDLYYRLPTTPIS